MPTTPPIGAIPHAPYRPLPHEAAVPVLVVGGRLAFAGPGDGEGGEGEPSPHRASRPEYPASLAVLFWMSFVGFLLAMTTEVSAERMGNLLGVVIAILLMSVFGAGVAASFLWANRITFGRPR